MPRDKEMMQKRNIALQKRYTELRKGKCEKWRTEFIYELLAEEFFLSVRRIEAILTSSSDK